jgi:hypothetical protein
MSRNGSTWKPDGSGWRARIGVLTHDDNTVSESEFWTMVPDGVSVHAARVPFTDLRTYGDPPGPDDATEQLARLPLQAIVYAWTWGSYYLSTTGEQELVARDARTSISEGSDPKGWGCSPPSATHFSQADTLVIRRRAELCT